MCHASPWLPGALEGFEVYLIRRDSLQASWSMLHAPRSTNAATQPTGALPVSQQIDSSYPLRMSPSAPVSQRLNAPELQIPPVSPWDPK